MLCEYTFDVQYLKDVNRDVPLEHIICTAQINVTALGVYELEAVGSTYGQLYYPPEWEINSIAYSEIDDDTENELQPGDKLFSEIENILYSDSHTSSIEELIESHME